MPAHPTDCQHRDTSTWSIETGAGCLSVSSLDEVEAAAVVRAWARCTPTPCEAPRGDLDRARLATLAWDQFHEELVHRATRHAIEAGRGSHLMFHAACLAALDTGAAVVLVAASGTGKTTATRTLGPHYGYLSDETAIVHPGDLTITPYPKPLSVLSPAGTRPKDQVSPDEIGLGQAPEATLQRICVLERVREPEERVTARAEPMPLVEALTLLVPQTSSLSHLPRGLVTLCRTLDRLGGALRLVYSEASDLRPVIDGLLAQQPAPMSPSWTPLNDQELSASPKTVPAAGAPDGDGAAVRRQGAECGIQLHDGRLVLLISERLVVLDGVGPAVWLLLDKPRTAADVVAHLRAEGPVPEDAEARVREAMDALITAQLATAD